tara:strand:+ start:45 stop:440 length:396 start_codon:yes stop_codon:yes gene_type:complete
MNTANMHPMTDLDHAEAENDRPPSNSEIIEAMALETPYLKVSVTHHDYHHPEGEWEETNTLAEWVKRLDEQWAQAHEDYDTYGYCWPSGIDNEFYNISYTEREIVEQLTHTCEQPVYTCALPQCDCDKVPF